MKYSILWLALGLWAVVPTANPRADGASGPSKTPEALKAEIEGLKPAKQAWRAIAWKNCPLEALAEARAKRRPVLTWVFLGNPTDERC
jgi:hypothetical protein